MGRDWKGSLDRRGRERAEFNYRRRGRRDRGGRGERAAMHDGRAKDSFSSPSSFSLEEEAPPRWEKKFCDLLSCLD